MKRVFTVKLKKVGKINPIFNCVETYQVIAPTAKQAIDQATKQFKKDEFWSGPVIIESLIHRGPTV